MDFRARKVLGTFEKRAPEIKTQRGPKENKKKKTKINKQAKTKTELQNNNKNIKKKKITKTDLEQGSCISFFVFDTILSYSPLRKHFFTARET